MKVPSRNIERKHLYPIIQLGHRFGTGQTGRKHLAACGEQSVGERRTDAAGTAVISADLPEMSNISVW
jgi:hypothetical protein